MIVDLHLVHIWLIGMKLWLYVVEWKDTYSNLVAFRNTWTLLTITELKIFLNWVSGVWIITMVFCPNMPWLLRPSLTWHPELWTEIWKQFTEISDKNKCCRKISRIIAFLIRLWEGNEGIVILAWQYHIYLVYSEYKIVLKLLWRDWISVLYKKKNRSVIYIL